MLYARNADFLRRLGVRVPAIFLDRTATRLLVLEDVGDRSLLDRVRALSGAARYRLYTDALDAVWPLHRDGARAARRERLPLAEPFSAQLYRWERELFLHHFMARRAGSVPSLVRAVMAELKTVADRLLREPPALIHRDLQSTNVHLSRGELVFLDFQGMRMGAAVYDLASLLCDPYASLDADLQRRLVGYYAGLSNQSPEHLLDAFWWAAVERLVQALGAYGRLGAMPETAHFSRHTQPGLDMLARAVQHTNKFWHLQELLCYVRNADAW
jgi:aminoglycoside/choline kinase family phosphotransferase